MGLLLTVSLALSVVTRMDPLSLASFFASFIIPGGLIGVLAEAVLHGKR